MLRSEWHREVQPGEFAGAMSIVFGMVSLVSGWLIFPPLVGVALALVGMQRAEAVAMGAEARAWSRLGFVLSAGGLLGWIGVWLFIF